MSNNLSLLRSMFSLHSIMYSDYRRELIKFWTIHKATYKTGKALLNELCRRTLIANKIQLNGKFPYTVNNLIIYIKMLFECDWLISVQLIPNSSVKICNHSAISCHLITEQFLVITLQGYNKVIWLLVDKQWDLKLTNQLI
jgi:hypothetical protein